MKLKFILSMAFLATVITFMSCSKASVGTANNSGDSTYLITQDSAFQSGNGIQVRVFMYNSSNELIKVEYRSGGSATIYQYDTISYTNNYPSKLLTYNAGNPNPTIDTTLLYYSQNGLLDSIREQGGQGSYMDSHVFFYTGNDLDSTSSHNYYGTNGNNGGPSAISHIVYAGNNLASGIAYMSGVPIAVTLTANVTAPNPYYGLVFNGNIDNFITFFDRNNPLEVYETLNPSNILLENSYTYANGRVATITAINMNNNNQSDTSMTILSYAKL